MRPARREELVCVCFFLGGDGADEQTSFRATVVAPKYFLCGIVFFVFGREPISVGSFGCCPCRNPAHGGKLSLGRFESAPFK